MSFLRSQFATSVNQFSDLPPAELCVNVVYRVNDLGADGFSFWVSDGLFWRPLNGFVSLYRFSGIQNAPIASIVCDTVNNEVLFVLPADINIPQGLIIPGSKLRLIVKLTFTSTCQYYVGLFDQADNCIGRIKPNNGVSASQRQMLFYLDAFYPSDADKQFAFMGNQQTRIIPEINTRTVFVMNFSSLVSSNENANSDSVLKFVGVSTSAGSASLALYSFELLFEA